jgi:hypothetical protein
MGTPLASTGRKTVVGSKRPDIASPYVAATVPEQSEYQAALLRPEDRHARPRRSPFARLPGVQRIGQIANGVAGDRQARQGSDGAIKRQADIAAERPALLQAPGGDDLRPFGDRRDA